MTGGDEEELCVRMAGKEEMGGLSQVTLRVIRNRRSSSQASPATRVR